MYTRVTWKLGENPKLSNNLLNEGEYHEDDVWASEGQKFDVVEDHLEDAHAEPSQLMEEVQWH